MLVLSINVRLSAQVFFKEEDPGILIPGNEQVLDTHKINTINRQAKALVGIHLDSAAQMFRQAGDWSKRIGYNEGIANSILGLAECETLKYNYKLSLQLLHKADRYWRLPLNTSYSLQYHKCILENYAALGAADSAIHYCYKALDQLQVMPDNESNDKAKWYFNMRLGDILALEKTGYSDFYRAFYYLGLSRHFAVKGNDKKNLIRTYLSFAAAYSNHANQKMSEDSIPDFDGYKSSIYYYQLAALLSEEIGHESYLGNAYLNQGTIYINRRMMDSGEYFINKAMALPVFGKVRSSKMLSYAALGLAYAKLNQYKKAELYLIKARNESIAIQNNVKMAEIDKVLYQFYKEINQNNKALKHLEAYTQLRDSMIDQEKVKAIAQWEIKYRTAEKDKDLALKNLKLSRQQNQIRKNNIWITSGLGSTLFLAGFLFFLHRNNRHKRRRQEEKLRFMEQEQQLWKQGEEIRNLKAMVKGEEKERVRLGRELHDGIVGQLAAVKINFNTIQDKYPMPALRLDLHAAIQHLDETAIELRKTAHNLMPEILIQQGLGTAVDSFCEKTSTFTGIQINFHQEGYVPRMDMDFELSAYRMIQELVQNIVKHANATDALVQFDYHEPLLIITVEDNGIGIVNETIEQTMGMGLNNLKTRVKALQGNFEISGSKGEGTSVYIELDISLIKQAVAL